MKLTEKYPPSLSNFLGDEQNLFEMRKAIRNQTPIFIHGPPGIGKTTTSKLLAKEMLLEIDYHNTSLDRTKETYLDLVRQSKLKSSVNKLIILDEIDGFKNWSVIKTIVQKCIYPIILIANDPYKVNADVKKLCTVIEFKAPYVIKVRKYIKEIARREGLEYRQEAVSRDIRASVNALLGGTKIDSFIEFDVIRQAIAEGNPENYDFRKHKIWLMENILTCYNGIDMLDAFTVFSVADRLQRPEVLKLLPKGFGNPEYPNYYRMLKSAKTTTEQQDDQ